MGSLKSGGRGATWERGEGGEGVGAGAVKGGEQREGDCVYGGVCAECSEGEETCECVS